MRWIDVGGTKRTWTESAQVQAQRIENRMCSSFTVWVGTQAWMVYVTRWDEFYTARSATTQVGTTDLQPDDYALQVQFAGGR